LLKILVEGDKSLLNQYSVIAVNKENCKNAKYDLAMRFSDWMAGKDTQTLIQNFKIFGKPLFTPNAK
jgi:tungstate transport system substrate-binding protein